MKRQAYIWYKDQKAGLLEELPVSYRFTYLPEYLAAPGARPVSLTLPLQDKPYATVDLHPFFDGLIPEGWLLDVAARTWKRNVRDRMGILLVACRDCIGAVSVQDCSTDADESL